MRAISGALIPMCTGLELAFWARIQVGSEVADPGCPNFGGGVTVPGVSHMHRPHVCRLIFGAY